LFARFQPKAFHGMVLRVIEDLRVSTNSHERARSYHFHGMVKCEVVNEPKYCGKTILEGEPCDVSFRDDIADASVAESRKKRSARNRLVNNSECDNVDDDDGDEDNIPLVELVKRKKLQKQTARRALLNTTAAAAAVPPQTIITRRRSPRKSR
jgi:hypothetical protein